MAPVADTTKSHPDGIQRLKANNDKIFNPFYSPSIGDDGDDGYEYSRFKPSFPEVSWEPLAPFDVVDRGLSADPEKKALFSAAKKIKHLTPAIGTELEGIDLRQLSDTQKDELALLVGERGVVFFRDQAIDIHEQLALARHFGPLHKHATTPIPREAGLHEVHVVYNDSSRRPDPSAYTKLELWHSDVTYELQPPSATSLKGIAIPDVGGDTLWSSGYALYSSLSPGFQKYLEGLTAVHSAVAQAQGARAGGTHVRRQEIETVHPVVRVHPATGWKSVYVNPGFTRRIVGVPKAESDAILSFLFHQISENPDFQVRFRWEKDSVAIWDNRVVTHSATFDFWPARRHALRATPHGERPLSVADYEKKFGKDAKDRQIEVWKSQGLDTDLQQNGGISGPKGYND
ncbi:TauD-domain-containing protein [Rickenella mellea]|uniref:TauD-domain-containing protein n=1 Tax=Rickenella mellea TaxID=50990 RepID=A0A4Y7Q0T4_9AGAM|nr:TauD-domain-containing protein [Rickenella mellea]